MLKFHDWRKKSGHLPNRSVASRVPYGSLLVAYGTRSPVFLIKGDCGRAFSHLSLKHNRYIEKQLLNRLADIKTSS